MTPKVHSYLSLDNDDKVDQITLVLSLVLILMGVNGFLFFSYQDQQTDLGEKIAVVTKSENQVQRKSLSSLVWANAQEQMVLYYGDEILTKDDSTSTIVFEDQTVLEIPANSLVRLTRSDEFIDINLIRGSFKLTAQSSDDKLLKNYRIKEASGQTVQVAPGVQYNLQEMREQKRAENPLIEGLALKNGMNLKVEKEKNIELFEKPISSAIELEYQLPTGQIKTEKLEQPFHLPHPLSGSYRFRFRDALQANSKWAPWTQIKISHLADYQIPDSLQKQVLEILGPKVDSPEEATIATLQASSDKELVDHEYVVYKDQQFETPLYTLPYTSEALKISLKEPGHYFWKLRRKDSDQNINPQEMAKITVKQALIDKEKASQLNISQKEALSYTLPLNYQENLKTEKVLIEVFKKQETQNLEAPVISQVKELTSEPIKVQIDQGSGEYLWRITPVDPQSLLAPSGEMTLNVEEKPKAPVRPILPKKLILNYVKVRGMDAYKIELPLQKNAAQYYLEVYRDPKLEQRVYQKLQNSHEFIWRTTRSGHYYYRYQFIDKWGRKSPISLRGDLFFPISPLINF